MPQPPRLRPPFGPGRFPGPARSGSIPDLRSGFSVRVAGVDRTSNIRAESMVMRLGSFDFTLRDPAAPPLVDNSVQVLEPAWNGTIVSVNKIHTGQPNASISYICTATNAKVATAAPAPFALSDAPDSVTSFKFNGLSIRTSRSDNGVVTNGTLTCWQPGLWPGMTFALTSAADGLSAAQYTVTNVTITWPMLANPVFAIEFGDAMVTLSAWTLNAINFGPDGTISGTKITDGSVTTPKLAANVVVANVINAGGTVTIDSTGITLKDANGSSVLTSAGFAGAWADRIASGLYNNLFVVATAGALTMGTSKDDTAGRTSALPYWTVWRGSGSGTVTVLTDSAWPGSHWLKFQFSGTGTSSTNNVAITSDLFPVLPVRQYRLNRTYGDNVPVGSTLNIERSIHWYDASGAFISTSTDIQAPRVSSGADALPAGGSTTTPMMSPTNARYGRVQFNFYETVAHDAATFAGVGSISRLEGENGDLYANFNAYVTSNLTVGGFMRIGGSAFPAAPIANDTFFRTDLGYWCFYDGTRWLTCHIETAAIQVQEALIGAAANATFWGPYMGAYNIYAIEANVATDVFTTNNGANFWTVQVGTQDAGVGTARGASFNTSADTVAQMTSHNVSLGVVLGTSTDAWYLQFTKTGAPGTIYALAQVRYRIIVT